MSPFSFLTALLLWFDIVLFFDLGAMEKNNHLVGKGVAVRLPPGFRFHPTDQELVVVYLARKTLGMTLPSTAVGEMDVCKSDPWDLPGKKDEPKYFFNCREAKYPNGRRCNRATESGYWKAIGMDCGVLAPGGNNRVAGMKKTLVFYQGKPSKGVRTDWIMHEYRMDSSFGPILIRKSLATPATAAAIVEKWVLCRIFLKKRAGNEAKCNLVGPRANAHTILYNLSEAPPSSSCDSSSITDEDNLEHEVESGSSGISLVNVSMK